MFYLQEKSKRKQFISLVKRVKMWCILEQKCFRYGKIKFLQHIALVCICVCNGSNLSANNMIKRKQLKITKTAITAKIAEKWGKALTAITSRSNWSFEGCKNDLVQEVFALIITLLEPWFMFSWVIYVTEPRIDIKIFNLLVRKIIFWEHKAS